TACLHQFAFLINFLIKKGLAMIYQKKNNFISRRGESARFKRSLLALYVMAVGMPSFALAQDTEADDEYAEEILVTGMRGSLSSAQDLKRNAGTVIDSITAKDLGSFPDKSV